MAANHFDLLDLSLQWNIGNRHSSPYSLFMCCHLHFHNIYTVRHRLHAVTHGACALYIYANMVQVI